MNKGWWEGRACAKPSFRTAIATLEHMWGEVRLLIHAVNSFFAQTDVFRRPGGSRSSQTTILRICSRLIRWDASRSQIPTKNDIVLMLSNSGESKELFDLIAYTQRNSIFTIAITSYANSALGKSCDLLLIFFSSRY